MTFFKTKKNILYRFFDRIKTQITNVIHSPKPEPSESTEEKYYDFLSELYQAISQDELDTLREAGKDRNEFQERVKLLHNQGYRPHLIMLDAGLGMPYFYC